MIEDLSMVDFFSQAGVALRTLKLGADSPEFWAAHIASGKLIVAGGYYMPIVQNATCAGFFVDWTPWRAHEELKKKYTHRGKISGALIVGGHVGYYHFAVGRLPSLIFARAFAPNAPIVWATTHYMPEGLQEIFPDTLEAILQGRGLQRIDLEDGEYDIENVIVPQVGAARVAGFFYRKLVLPLIVRKVGLVDGLDGLKDLKLFVRRISGSRLLLNQDEIEQWHVQRGYIAIDPGRMTFQEQALTFARATEIVGVEGGALTNLVFAVRARSVIVMANPVAVHDRFFSSIVEPFNVSYQGVAGMFVVNPPDESEITRNTNFWVSLAEVEKAHVAISARGGSPR
jgi:hypothetical protein